MTGGDESAGRGRKQRGDALQRDLVRRIMTELRHGERKGRRGDPTAAARSAMNGHSSNHLLERLERGDSLEHIGRDLRSIGGLSDDERAALWLLAWGEHQRRTLARHAGAARSDALPGIAPCRRCDRRSARSRELIASTLELARAETSMDVAVLGEIHDGREVVRLLAGEAESFGLAVGASLPVEETYCQRLLEGRLGNVVADASSEALVRDLELTSAARIGSYIGVPLTTLDARLYILCCLAHEERPALCERDVLFLRGLAETIVRELDAAPLE
jgi:GAF domain-containing protein